MEATVRERKRDPYTCAGCGARFDVAYYDDRADSAPSLHDVGCPSCGRAKSISLPLGSERTRGEPWKVWYLPKTLDHAVFNTGTTPVEMVVIALK